ncbi:hypothetical protein ACKWTF_006017 [Chironomus riparius]
MYDFTVHVIILLLIDTSLQAPKRVNFEGCYMKNETSLLSFFLEINNKNNMLSQQFNMCRKTCIVEFYRTFEFIVADEKIINLVLNIETVQNFVVNNIYCFMASNNLKIL